MPSRVTTPGPAKQGTNGHRSNNDHTDIHTNGHTKAQSNRSRAPNTYWVFNLDDIFSTLSHNSGTRNGCSQTAGTDAKVCKNKGMYDSATGT